MADTAASSSTIVSRAWSSFFGEARRCLAVAFVFSTVVFVICFIAWVPNSLNDDWAISSFLSGNWPGEQGLCLIVNAALTQLIYQLNQLLPSFNWFFVLEAATAYAAYLTIVYQSLRRLPMPFAALTVATVTMLILPGCTYEPNFSYIAGISACAGGMLLLASQREPRHVASLVIGGVVFMMLAFLWRRNMFLLCIPIFGVAALGVVALGGKETPLLARAKRIWPFILVLVVFGGFLAYTTYAWSQPEMQEWIQFNAARHGYVDYKHRAYDKVADELAALGVSENDYELLDKWIHEDPEFYTKELLTQINEATTIRYDTPAKVMKVVAEYLKDLVTAPKMAFVFIPMLLFSIVCLRGRPRKVALAIIGCALLVSLALAIAGRLPVRVKYPVLAYAAVACGVGAWKVCSALGRDPAAGSAQGETRGRATMESAKRVVEVLSLALPVIAVGFVLFTACTHVNLSKLQPIFDAQDFEADSFIEDYIYEHPDNVFVMNTATNSILTYAHKAIAPYDEEIIARTVTLGGWSARSPYTNARNEAAGLSNPIKGLVDNEDALYLSPGYETTDMLKTYLREHYYPNATYTLVDELHSPITSTIVYVFKFSEE